jgi:hypothetical protein
MNRSCRAAMLAAITLVAGPCLAQAAGVRIIVEVVPRTDAAPDIAIGEAQSQVLAALPGGSVVILARYRYMPFLALEVDPEMIEAIRDLPGVASVRPDRTWSAQ